LLASDILGGGQLQKVLGTLNFIRNVSERDIISWSNLLNDEFTKATTAIGASPSSIALRVLEYMGELFHHTFDIIPEIFREIDENIWIDVYQHGLTRGEANVCVSASPVEALISLYTPLRRLPQASEVLFCDSSTDSEAITLWLRRAFDSACSGEEPARLFSLVYADALSLELQLKTTTSFKQMLSSKAYSKARKRCQVIFLCKR